MAINCALGQFPQMENETLDPFVKGLEIAMATDGWKMKPLSEKASLGDTAIRDLFRKSSSPKVSTALAIAKAMGRTIDELIEMGTTGQFAAPKEQLFELSFAEPVTAYTFREQPTEETDPQAGLRRIFGSRARSPATLQAKRDYPGLNISCGDVVVMDLSRLPKPGELCALRIEDDKGNSTTEFRRYLPPYLVEDGAGFSSEPLSVDDPRLTIRNPIIGLLRGLPEAS